MTIRADVLNSMARSEQRYRRRAVRKLNRGLRRLADQPRGTTFSWQLVTVHEDRIPTWQHFQRGVIPGIWPFDWALTTLRLDEERSVLVGGLIIVNIYQPNKVLWAIWPEMPQVIAGTNCPTAVVDDWPVQPEQILDKADFQRAVLALD